MAPSKCSQADVQTREAQAWVLSDQDAKGSPQLLSRAQQRRCLKARHHSAHSIALHQSQAHKYDQHNQVPCLSCAPSELRSLAAASLAEAQLALPLVVAGGCCRCSPNLMPATAHYAVWSGTCMSKLRLRSKSSSSRSAPTTIAQRIGQGQHHQPQENGLQRAETAVSLLVFPAGLAGTCRMVVASRRACSALSGRGVLQMPGPKARPSKLSDSSSRARRGWCSLP